jgi:autotransporter adhesin
MSSALTSGLSSISNNLADVSSISSSLSGVSSSVGAISSQLAGSGIVGGSATGTDSLSVGRKSNAAGTNSVALGANSTAAANNSVAIGGGVVNATATGAVAIGVGSVADRPNSVEFGTRVLGGVKAGVRGTDAVNKDQLDEVSGESRRGVATAAALAGLPQADAGKVAMLGVAIAGHKGKQALAVGLNSRIHENVKVNIGAAISGDSTTYNIGAGFQW